MANLITWNPNDKGNNVTLSNNNLTATRGSLCLVRATEGKSNGKWYWEINVIQGTGKNYSAILMPEKTNVNASPWYDGFGYSNDADYGGGTLFLKGVAKQKGLPSYTNGDILGIAIDLDSTPRNIKFYKNNELVLNTDILLGDKILFPSCGNGASSGDVGTANFGTKKFNIMTSNPSEWKSLVRKGYKPYDVNNAKWFGEKFLIQQGVEVYSIDYNYIKLGEPTSDVQLNQWFELYGYNDIGVLLEDSTRRTVSSKKEQEVYETRIVDFKQFLGNVEMKELTQMSDNVSYDSTPYKLLDDIKKINNGKFNVLVKK